MLKELQPGFSLGGRIERTLHNEVIPIFKNGSDEYWMEQALLTAMNAVGWSAPNPSVGCVIVKNNQLIASGYTQAYRHEHAERMAFLEINNDEKLKAELIDATVYVTLEPCSHFGNQPPCVDLLVQSPIKRVVIGCQDPDSRVSGAGIEKLKLAGKEVVVGILEPEVRAWHFPFLKNRTSGKPVWIAKWAQTESGHLADADGNSKWITNEQSRAYTHWLRQKYDAILVGAQTFIQDKPSLTVRDCANPHRRNPHRLIYDPKARLAALSTSELNASLQNPIFIYYSGRISKAVVDSAPQGEGVYWIRFDESIESFIESVEATAFARPLQSIFCEGGAQLLNQLMHHGIFSAVHRFLGQKNFKTTDQRHLVEFHPSEEWKCLIKHQFQDDVLQEWVKCF